MVATVLMQRREGGVAAAVQAMDRPRDSDYIIRINNSPTRGVFRCVCQRTVTKVQGPLSQQQCKVSRVHPIVLTNDV